MSSSSSSSPPGRPGGKCQRVSLREIEDATENFNERYALGQGGEAKVYRAQIMLIPWNREITQVAVKHLNHNSPGFDDEIQIMSKIQHPNIVSLLGYCTDSGQKILIYEYMANGSLADYVQKKRQNSISLSWQQRLQICLGAALGLKHLHAETKEFSKGIIHRDVKPDNILLDANWVAKISDFGMFKLSRADQIDSAMPTMLKGTGGYYAPEYIKYQHVTRKIDVYAFGVVLFQMLCRKMPWDRGDESYYGMEEEDLGQWARENVDPEIRGEISDYCLNTFTKIIGKSLSVNPKNRPTMNEVVLNLQNIVSRKTIDYSQALKKINSKLYLFEEVCKHNKKDDCWIIISGKVYDVTPFMDNHPGGDEVLLEVTGKDATNDFEDIGHTKTAIHMMRDFYVGDIVKTYTFKEVCKHNKMNDCWIIVSGMVYDVTSFVDDHPGGEEVILQATGKDATNDFEDVGHSNVAKDIMKDFFVGILGLVGPITDGVFSHYLPSFFSSWIDGRK